MLSRVLQIAPETDPRINQIVRQTYTQVKHRYEQLRQTAFEAAYKILPNVMPNKHGMAVLKQSVSFDTLTFEAQHQLRRWEKSGLRRVAWNWDEVRKKYRAHPNRFELSIWYGNLTLAGATIGKPTRGGGKLRLDYIEAAPMGTPLDGLVTDMAIEVSQIYADSIGATQIRIMNPVNEGVRNHNLSKPGFSYHEKGNYCFLDLV